jgi:hypothetical protein
MFISESRKGYEAMKRQRPVEAQPVVAQRVVAAGLTNKEWKELARILRDDQLPAATQWKIVGAIWAAAMIVIAAAYLSVL